MSLYDMMTNINNIDYLTTLDNIIKEIREEYKDLDETQTCKIYSGLLSDRLNNLHIPNRIINTTKLGSTYEHEFVLIPYKDEFILSDLTYSQFHCLDPNLVDLLDKGYMVINDELLNEYLQYVTSDIESYEFNVFNTFYDAHHIIKK